MNKSVLKKIREKREFSMLPEKDIRLAYEKFEKRQATEQEKIILTKELLRQIFTAFVSPKLLSIKNKDEEWILRKHISTRERLPYYEQIYQRIFKNYKKASVVDLGSGINGFSYKFFKKLKLGINYTAIESVGQLVEFMNFYFKGKKANAKAIHLSLFEKEQIKKIISKKEGPVIVFLFKVIDALESLKRDYSKELISSLADSVDEIVLSFSTKSLGGKEKFKANRKWIIDFIQENFEVQDDFEIGGERYLIFGK